MSALERLYWSTLPVVIFWLQGWVYLATIVARHHDGRHRGPFSAHGLFRRRRNRGRATRGKPSVLALVRRNSLGGERHHTECKIVLLGNNSLLTNPLHGTWRLAGWFRRRRLWYRLRIKRVGFRRRTKIHNCTVRLDQGFAHDLVLAGFHTHATVWLHAGVPPRQAPCQWRPELQLMGGLVCPVRLHRGLDRVHPAAYSLDRSCGMTLLNRLSMQR